MLYREIIAVCSEIHTKHINTLCGQNVELLNVKHDIYIDCRLQTVTSSVMPPCAARRVLPSVRPCLYGFHPSLASSRLTLWSHYWHSFRTAGVSACRWIRSRADLQWAGWLDVMCGSRTGRGRMTMLGYQQHCGRDGHECTGILLPLRCDTVQLGRRRCILKPFLRHNNNNNNSISVVTWMCIGVVGVYIHISLIAARTAIVQLTFRTFHCQREQ
jgi:hypothetical protein